MDSKFYSNTYVLLEAVRKNYEFESDFLTSRIFYESKRMLPASNVNPCVLQYTYDSNVFRCSGNMNLIHILLKRIDQKATSLFCV